MNKAANPIKTKLASFSDLTRPKIPYIVPVLEQHYVYYHFNSTSIKLPSTIVKKILDVFLKLGYSDSCITAEEELERYVSKEYCMELVALLRDANRKGELKWQ